jgi:phosphoribosylamine--glycine ligase
MLEFNVRFGDPETEAVLPLIESDLVEAMEACVEGKLESCRMTISHRTAVSVVLASEGYPAKPETGRKIEGLDSVAERDALLFHAGTRKERGAWKTTGGRVLNVAGLGSSVEDARARAYAAVDKIRFEGMQPALAAKR